MAPKSREVEERFWALAAWSKDVEACWQWTGAQQNGYGRFAIVANTAVLAHRLAYELEIGDIPDGFVIDHLCRNRGCVNPWHMEAVTHRENTIRGTSPPAVNSRKTRCGQEHDLSGANLYVDPKTGSRHCRTCMTHWRRTHVRIR